MDANSTIYDALDAIARGPEGASPAVLFHDTASDSSRRQISFRDLARLSLAAAAFLSEKCGVKRGDSIVIFLPSNVEWLAFYFASTRLGAVAINLNTRLRESEIRHVLKTSGARLVVVEQGFVGTDYVGIVAGAVEGAGFGQVTVVNVGKQDASLNGAAAGLRVLKYSLPSGAGLADFDRLQNDPRMRQGRPDDLSATFTT